MKKFYPGILVLLVTVYSQAQSYTFEELSGDYSDLDGSTIIQDANYEDDSFHFIDLEGETIALYGLDFNFGGITTFVIQALGNVRIDNDSSAILLDGARSLDMNILDETSQLSYLIDGEPGTYVIKTEWRNHTMLTGTQGNFFNFQIWVYQETGVIEFRYGPRTGDNTLGITDENGPYVGIAYAPDNFFFYYEKLWLSGEIDDIHIEENPTALFERMLGIPTEGTIYRFTPTFLSTQDHFDKEELKDFAIAPNPATESIVIQGVPEPILKVDILDLQGKVISQFSNSSQIDISALDSGIYIIRVETQSRQGVKRFVKQ